MKVIPEAELLLPVHDVMGIITIWYGRCSRRRIAGAIDVDHDSKHFRQLTRGARPAPDPGSLPTTRWKHGSSRRPTTSSVSS